MDIDEAALLEELVNGIGSEAADAEHGLEGVRAWAQVRHRAQIFQRVALFLQGIVRRGSALDRDLLGLQLKGLAGVRRFDECAADDESSTDIRLGNGGKIIHRIMIDDLQRLEERAVTQDDKAERLGRADGAHPAADRDRLPGVVCGVLEQVSNSYELHNDFNLSCVSGFAEALR